MFSSNRYWGEDESTSQSALTLDGLHLLAQQRAQERRGLLRKLPNDGASSDDEELKCRGSKQAKLSDGAEEGGKGQLKPEVSDCSSDESGLLGGESTSSSSESEEEEEEEEGSVLDTSRPDSARPSPSKADEETTPTLAPLGRNKPGGKEGKKIVHRQLPEWILNPQIVENDIQKFSKPIEDFSLHHVLVTNLTNSGMGKLFPVQAHVVPFLLSSLHGPLLTGVGGSTPRDVCVCAPTGCGKTLCYVLPILTALINRVVQQVRALVVVPSQELASQVQGVFQLLTRGTGLSVRTVCGQAPLEVDRAVLWDRAVYPPASKVDVLIATPGRLVEHLDSGSFVSLGFLRFLVIDEADKLLGQHFNQWLPKLLRVVSRDKATPKGCGLGRLEDTLQGLCLHPQRYLLMTRNKQKGCDKISPSIPPEFRPPSSPLQKLLFSATMTQNPEYFASLQLHHPKLFSISNAMQLRGAEASELTFGLPEQLVEKRVRCQLKHKPLALVHLVRGCGEEGGEMQKVLCFTNSRDSTHRLFLLLKAFDYFPVAEISSSIGQGRRQKILADFKSGATRMLICSDQMSRGMDVEGVTCVINYEPPRQFGIYLHRAGRTARAGQRGVVYTLLAKDEVHAFSVMMRQVNRRAHLDDLKISSSDLQDYFPQYQDVLEKLKQCS